MRLLFSLTLLVAASARAEMLLVGTIAAGPRGVATIVSGGETVSLRLGEVVDGWILERVEAGLVELRRGKVARELRTGDFVTDQGIFERGIEVSGDEVVLSRGVHDHIVGEGLMAVLMDATATPVYGLDGLVGFKVWNFDPGSVYDLVGLQNGDVVREIDGSPLDSVVGAIALLRSVQVKRNFRVSIDRHGVRRTLVVTVRGF